MGVSLFSGGECRPLEISTDLQRAPGTPEPKGWAVQKWEAAELELFPLAAWVLANVDGEVWSTSHTPGLMAALRCRSL